MLDLSPKMGKQFCASLIWGKKATGLGCFSEASSTPLIRRGDEMQKFIFAEFKVELSVLDCFRMF